MSDSPTPVKLPPVLRRPGVLAGGGVAAILGAGALALVVGLSAVFTAGWSTAVFGLLAVGAALLSAAAAATSAAASRASAEAARVTYEQQLHERARSAHADLTTGEVAAARDRLGVLARDRHRLWSDGGPPVGELRANVVQAFGGAERSWQRMTEARRDWFTLLWGLQRVHATHTMLSRAPLETRQGDQESQAFLLDLVRAQVDFLDVEAVHARAALEEFFEEPVDDAASQQAFVLLASLLLPRAPGRWARPLTTQVGSVLQPVLLKTPSFALEALSDEQLLALHQALFAGESGEHMADRVELGRRMRQRATKRQAMGDEDGARRLSDWAQAVEAALPTTEDPPEA